MTKDSIGKDPPNAANLWSKLVSSLRNQKLYSVSTINWLQLEYKKQDQKLEYVQKLGAKNIEKEIKELMSCLKMLIDKTRSKQEFMDLEWWYMRFSSKTRRRRIISRSIAEYMRVQAVYIPELGKFILKEELWRFFLGEQRNQAELNIFKLLLQQDEPPKTDQAAFITTTGFITRLEELTEKVNKIGNAFPKLVYKYTEEGEEESIYDDVIWKLDDCENRVDYLRRLGELISFCETLNLEDNKNDLILHEMLQALLENSTTCKDRALYGLELAETVMTVGPMPTITKVVKVCVIRWKCDLLVEISTHGNGRHTSESVECFLFNVLGLTQLGLDFGFNSTSRMAFSSFGSTKSVLDVLHTFLNSLDLDSLIMYVLDSPVFESFVSTDVEFLFYKSKYSKKKLIFMDLLGDIEDIMQNLNDNGYITTNEVSVLNEFCETRQFREIYENKRKKIVYARSKEDDKMELSSCRQFSVLEAMKNPTKENFEMLPKSWFYSIFMHRKGLYAVEFFEARNSIEREMRRRFVKAIVKREYGRVPGSGIELPIAEFDAHFAKEENVNGFMDRISVEFKKELEKYRDIMFSETIMAHEKEISGLNKEVDKQTKLLDTQIATLNEVAIFIAESGQSFELDPGYVKEHERYLELLKSSTKALQPTHDRLKYLKVCNEEMCTNEFRW